jgi:hypothetical protein
MPIFFHPVVLNGADVVQLDRVDDGHGKRARAESVDGGEHAGMQNEVSAKRVREIDV